jgi:hypothetical protein
MPHPVVTAESVQRLIIQLDADLRKVEISSAPPVGKGDLEVRIRELQHLLTKMKNDLATNPTADISGWTAQIAPLFDELTPMLREALNLTAQDTGACCYNGGCIVCTSTQCQGLGTFKQGQPCSAC